MNVLYVSTLCSNRKFKEIFENSSIKPQQQAQKFHNLLSRGLMHLVNSLYILSRPPVNKLTNEKVKTSGAREIYNNVIYHYLNVIEKPFLKHASLFVCGFVDTIKWIYRYKEQKKIIICDVLNLSISISSFLASKLCAVKNVAIVTDIPSYMQHCTIQKRSLIEQLVLAIYIGVCNFFMHRYDYYVILTEQMNELVNPFGRPHIVIEGMVDIEMKHISNELRNKYEEKIIIYAGALYRNYGIKKLIDAFAKLEDDNARLWLYGAGEMETEIKNYEIMDERIKFFGIVPNETVVQEQLKATLLINPRPSSEEFTKYSFPSKNMEYMVSGTPILTARLPGMPKEYEPYVYLLEDETTEGLANTLGAILRKPRNELHEKGNRAKQFMLKNKNNLVQARGVMDLIGKID